MEWFDRYKASMKFTICREAGGARARWRDAPPLAEQTGKERVGWGKERESGGVSVVGRPAVASSYALGS